MSKYEDLFYRFLVMNLMENERQKLGQSQREIVDITVDSTKKAAEAIATINSYQSNGVTPMQPQAPQAPKPPAQPTQQPPVEQTQDTPKTAPSREGFLALYNDITKRREQAEMALNAAKASCDTLQQTVDDLYKMQLEIYKTING